MGGVVSARKAQYFEPRYEGDKKPSARVAPGRTGSDIFPDKKASAPAAAAAPSQARGDPQGRADEAPQPINCRREGAARVVRTEGSPLPQGACGRQKLEQRVPVGQSLPGYFSQPC